MREIPIFPLGTVLFPQGVLPLKIFEQRYLDMTKCCIRDDSPFGVCLIRDGAEVGAPAMPHQIGCTARIEEWEMPHLGIFHLVCRGESVFRIVEQWTGKTGLITAVVEEREPLRPQHLPGAYSDLGDLMRKIVDKVGAENVPEPVRLDDADWVANRLVEVLPVDLEFKQLLLETPDAIERLTQLQALLQDKSVVIGD